MMQDRRALFAGLTGAFLAGKAVTKAVPQADDAEAPDVCPRCGRMHGKPDAPLKAGAK